MNETITGVLSSPWIMWGIIAAFIALLIVDLIKRHTLSKTAVWYIVTLLIPAIFIYSCLFVGTSTFVGAGNVFWSNQAELSALGIVMSWVAVLIVCVLILTIFIRNNIVPLDKNKTVVMDKERTKYLSSKRLIKAGLIGTAAYSVIFIALLVYVIAEFGSAVQMLGLMLIFLLFPVLNLISILYFCALGTIWVVIVVFAIGLGIALIPLMNGCIRYSIVSNEKKSMKALWSFLSLIPIFNFGLGIYYIVKLKREGY